MQAPGRRLTVDDVERHITECCVAPAAGAGGRSSRVGVEVESLIHGLDGPGSRIALEAIQEVVDTLGPLPAGGRITFEPGGQVEVSSPPAGGPGAACAVVRTDLAVLEAALSDIGATLSGCGLDPVSPPERARHSPRYDAMEAYFDCVSPKAQAGLLANPGRTMMCSTASVQVNVDYAHDVSAAWHLAHDLGPVLVATFANSPLALGRPTGWRSARVANWWALDPPRTLPIEPAPPAFRPVNGSGPAAVVAQVTEYVLAAPVMLRRDAEERYTPICPPVPFADWLESGLGGVYPTLSDLEYHMTTLFPPVRPRGWLEFRMIDRLPDPWWAVPVAVTATLVGDPEVARDAYPQLAATRGLWLEAARHGLDHPVLAEAAALCLGLVAGKLDGIPDDKELADLVRAYAERYTDRGRCPADDLLADWRLAVS
jgi:glutamate--cysteine ligase